MSQMGDLERLQFQLEMLPQEKEDPDAQKPTVIFLMSESFFDVTKLPAVSFCGRMVMMKGGADDGTYHAR